MPRPKPDDDELKERTARQEEWRTFRREFLFSQKKLGDVLNLSRRTIQEIEAGRVSPHRSTLRAFRDLKLKYDAERAA